MCPGETGHKQSTNLAGGREGTGGLRYGFPVKSILTTEEYTRMKQVKREAVVVLKTEPDF